MIKAIYLSPFHRPEKMNFQYISWICFIKYKSRHTYKIINLFQSIIQEENLYNFPLLIQYNIKYFIYFSIVRLMLIHFDIEDKITYTLLKRVSTCIFLIHWSGSRKQGHVYTQSKYFIVTQRRKKYSRWVILDF